jgi:ATP-dependent DNA helicase RecG
MAAEEKDSGKAAPGLEDTVLDLPAIGPTRAQQLAQLGIRRVRDLLFHFPRDYQDRSRLTPIAEAVQGEEVTLEGEVVSARNIRLRGRMSMAVVKLRDGTGEITATFFGRGFMANTTFRPGARGIFTGQVSEYKGPALKNPEYEMLAADGEEDTLNTGRITPVYRLTEKVSQRMLRRWIWNALESHADDLEETLPVTLRKEYGFPDIRGAIRAAHFPESLEAARTARERFAYEELLGLQIGILRERALRLHTEEGNRHLVNGPFLTALRAALPFELTGAQQRAVTDLLEDMASPRPMVRLLQGDVGCGKTIVALHAIAAAADGGFQTAMMAPTEILAEQHAIQLRALLEPLGISVELLTGSLRASASIRSRIAAGEAMVVAGTQTLIQEKTIFDNLGLVVIDEQHRFGVTQRQRLSEKGVFPDILHMSATPIPRTLAITVYGGMDISVIDELPPGRRPVKTRKITPAKIPGMYEFIRKQAAKGFQTYIICPLVDESELRDDLTPVIRHFEALSAGPLSGLRCELLHGRLDAREKEDALTRFRAGKIDVLFSTTVIEVGIDVPAATTMVIEDAGQFGLTQLHQLRGRVGRGAEQAWCFLAGKARTEDGKRRLKILCENTSGFDIAEEDLKLRGPGEFYGARQAGLSDLRVADLIRDVRLLDQARRDARAVVDEDPRLEKPEHQPLRRIPGPPASLAV